MTERQEQMIWCLCIAIFAVTSATPGLNKLSIVIGLFFLFAALVFRLRND